MQCWNHVNEQRIDTRINEPRPNAAQERYEWRQNGQSPFTFPFTSQRPDHRYDCREKKHRRHLFETWRLRKRHIPNAFFFRRMSNVPRARPRIRPARITMAENGPTFGFVKSDTSASR